ncbi:TPA: glucosyltransferase domain-containing protein [Escherichia coli]|nr:glucosyltransferase domain-containing protein [Escherichia coli]HBC1316847.1 glucosyltransferase domain-containing protein [Escherichia coli]
MNSLIKIINRDRFIVLSAFICCVIFAFPFMLHGVYFVDDWMRSDIGRTSWEQNGRPLSAVIMSLLSMSGGDLRFFGDGVVSDIFPGSLFMTCAVMVIAGVLIYDALRLSSPFSKFACATLVFVNPFWIGNLAFRFDTLVMSLSFLFSACAAINSNKNTIKSNIFSIILMVLTLCTYQASINVYIGLFFAFVALRISDRATWFSLFKFSTSYVAVLISAYAIYKLLILNNIELSDYTKYSGELISTDMDFMAAISDNFDKYSTIGLNAFHGTLYAVMILIIAISCIAPPLAIKSATPVQKSLLFIAPLLVALSSIVTLLVLKHPALTSRVFIGFSAVMIYSIWALDIINRRYAHSLSLIFMIMVALLSSSVSNAMNDTQRFERFIAQRIADKLYDLGFKDGDKVFYTGRPGTPDAPRRASEKNPFINEFLVSSFANHNFKYSLMRQYNVRSATPDIYAVAPYTSLCDKSKEIFADNLMTICRVKDAFVVKINRI